MEWDQWWELKNPLKLNNNQCPQEQWVLQVSTQELKFVHEYSQHFLLLLSVHRRKSVGRTALVPSTTVWPPLPIPSTTVSYKGRSVKETSLKLTGTERQTNSNRTSKSSFCSTFRNCEDNHSNSTAILLHNYNGDQIVKSETKVTIAQSCFAQSSNYGSIQSILPCENVEWRLAYL